MLRTIVVAVFVKDDLIQAQIDNLLALEGIDQYKVLFYQDNIINSPKYDTEYYLKKLNNIKEIIENNLKLFKHATFIRNDININPYANCKKSMDHAFIDSDYAIFIEDDVFFARNALLWFNYFYDTNQITWDTYKFVSGESIFYDTQSITINPTKEQVISIKENITNNKYQQYFIVIDHFLTASIFATTKSIWNTNIRDIKGSIIGDCKLNDEINKNKWKSIFPVVPFAKDIGMLHDDGWSVAWNGKSGVREIKNTYLMADEFDTPSNFIKLPDSFDKSIFYPTLS